MPPDLASAHPWSPSLSMATVPEVSPTTSPGVAREVVELSPSAPSTFRPQHLTPPVAVEPPALHAPRGRQRAAVLRAGGDGDRARREARDVGRGAPLDQRAVADLADGVGAPALRRAGGGDRADVVVARRHPEGLLA